MVSSSHIWTITSFLLIPTALLGSFTYDSNRGEQVQGKWWSGRPQPYFVDTPSNISLISGQPAYLPCRVHMLGNRAVTWMRMRDLHILTVGLVTYSADERFQIIHSEETDDWTLQIQYTQPRDSGAYKCQVNSDNKIARNVYLSVVDRNLLDKELYKLPDLDSNRGTYTTTIVGKSQRFLQAGSPLSLDCIITHTKAGPPAVLWYRNDNLLDYDSPRGGISIQLEKTDSQTSSHLLLSAVEVQDSGNYTCVPVGAPRASVSVHVHSDEIRAAVQQDGLSGSNSEHCSSFILVITIVSFCLVNALPLTVKAWRIVS